MDAEKLVKILVAEGYTEDAALKVVIDVINARKLYRERELAKYIGTRKTISIGGLQIEVVIKDATLDDNLEPKFQVTPVNGKKTIWVNEFINI